MPGVNDNDSQTTSSEASAASPLVSVRTAAAVIVLVAGAAYSGSFTGAFVFDDTTAIVRNPNIQQLGDPLKAMFGSHDMRPVTSLTFALNYAVSGLKTWSYHAVNLAIHVAAALLLMGVVRRALLGPRLRKEFADAATPLAAAIVLLWAVHPLTTSAVTYIVQRGESMMSLFYLLTLYCVARGASSQRPWGWWIAAAGAAVVGAGCKQVMVTVPVVALLYDRVFLAGSWRELVRRRWPVHTLLLGVWVALAALYATLAKGSFAGFNVPGVTPMQYLLSQPEAILRYLSLSVWPKGLCLDYGWPPVATLATAKVPLVKTAALLTATLLALWRRPAWGFLGASFFIILSPSSSILPLVDAAYEYRMYLPLAAVVAGVVMVAYLAGQSLLERIRSAESRQVAAQTLAGVAVVATVGALGWLTYRRNAVYTSDLAMYADIVRKRPGNPRGHVNLALAFHRRQAIDQAKQQYASALEAIDRRAQRFSEMGRDDLVRGVSRGALAAKVYIGLGVIYESEGGLEEARRILVKGADLYYDGIGHVDRMDHFMVRMNLARVLVRLGDRGAAVSRIREAIAMRSDQIPAWAACASLQREMDDPAGALATITEALALHLDAEPLRTEAALALSVMGRYDEALAHARRGMELAPTSARPVMALALARVGAGDLAGAIRSYNQAGDLPMAPSGIASEIARLQILQRKCRAQITRLRKRHRDAPEDVDAAVALARALATSPDAAVRDGAEAVRLAEKAVAASPKKPEYLDALAVAQAETGRFADAATTMRKAIALATAAGYTGLLPDYRDRLKLYTGRRAFRESAPGED